MSAIKGAMWLNRARIIAALAENIRDAAVDVQSPLCGDADIWARDVSALASVTLDHMLNMAVRARENARRHNVTGFATYAPARVRAAIRAVENLGNLGATMKGL